MEKDNKVIKFKKYNLLIVFLLLIIGGSLYIGIVMAQVTIDLTSTGEITLMKQNGIVITDVTLFSKSNGETYLINNFNKSILNTKITLENNPTSYLTYAVTVKNTTTDSYIFDEIIYDSDPAFYSNSNIVTSIETNSSNGSINLGETLNPQETKTFYVKFNYDNVNNITDTTLDAVLNFKFRKVYNITYTNITMNQTYPTTALEGKNLVINFVNPAPDALEITMNGESYTGFTYTNHTLTIQNVTGDISIEGTVQVIEFTSTTNSITNTDVNGMTLDEFTSTTFNLVNNSERKIKSITITITANMSGSGSQYLTPRVTYDGTTKTTSISLKSTSQTPHDVTAKSVSMNLQPRIENGTEFTLNFTGTPSTSATVYYIVSYTITANYQ